MATPFYSADGRSWPDFGPLAGRSPLLEMLGPIPAPPNVDADRRFAEKVETFVLADREPGPTSANQLPMLTTSWTRI